MNFKVEFSNIGLQPSSQEISRLRCAPLDMTSGIFEKRHCERSAAISGLAAVLFCHFDRIFVVQRRM